MKKINILQKASVVIIVLTTLAILNISIMAFINPRAVMDMVQVKLTNTDAISSIRGVYGGIGLLLCIQLLYLLYKNQLQGLVMVTLFAGFYACSRIITIFIDGSLGAFGMQWLYIETLLGITALVVLVLRRRYGQTTSK